MQAEGRERHPIMPKNNTGRPTAELTALVLLSLQEQPQNTAELAALLDETDTRIRRILAACRRAGWRIEPHGNREGPQTVLGGQAVVSWPDKNATTRYTCPSCGRAVNPDVVTLPAGTFWECPVCEVGAAPAEWQRPAPVTRPPEDPDIAKAAAAAEKLFSEL